MRWLALVVIAACGGGHSDLGDLHDGPVAHDDSFGCPATSGCSVLTQAGCTTAEKCTWAHSTNGTDDSPALGAIACVTAGTAALGESCSFSPVDPNAGDSCHPTSGFDNCVGGTVCSGGVCKQICDNQGGTPRCPATQACVTYEGLFANAGATTTPAGVCDPSCDPLADNDFDGSGTRFTKPGTACGSDPTIGCYGFPSTTHVTNFSCAIPASGTELLTHRSPVPDNKQYLNSCMSGYELSVVYDHDGSTQVDCFAWCSPGDSYLGATTQAPNGVAPHRCNTTDALGNFGATPDGSAASNGEHCTYSWLYELDQANALHRSPTSDTVGICIDHTKYRYDADGDGTLDTVIPPCAALPIQGDASTAGAADFGCVSTTLAMPVRAINKRLRLGLQLPEPAFTRRGR